MHSVCTICYSLQYTVSVSEGLQCTTFGVHRLIDSSMDETWLRPFDYTDKVKMSGDQRRGIVRRGYTQYSLLARDHNTDSSTITPENDINTSNIPPNRQHTWTGKIAASCYITALRKHGAVLQAWACLALVLHYGIT